MRKLTAALAFIASLLPLCAAAQVPNFPQTLPANTVVGRLGSGPGPSQAIPFSVLTAIIGGGSPPFAGITTLVPNLPLIGNGTGQVQQGTRTGSTTKFATSNGTLTTGNCISIDSSGNFIDAGAPCGVGGGGNLSATQDFIAGIGFTPGTTTQLTLSSTPASVNMLLVTFDGIVQSHNTYSLSVATITFLAPIPASVQVVEAQWYTPAVGSGVTSLGGMTGVITCGLGLTCGSGSIATSRIPLSAPLTLYVSTTGSDANLCTISNQCRTRTRAYAVLAQGYDLGGQVVTIQLADGVYTDSFQNYDPMLLGQHGAAGIVFSGNCTTPSNVVIQPAANLGYAYGAAFGASYTIQCQVVDQTSQRSIAPSGADIISVGQGSKVIFGNSALFGVRRDMIFGCNYSSFNAITVSFFGFIQVNNDFDVDVTRCQATTTGVTTISSNTLTSVASITNVTNGMGISAANLPGDAYVTGTSAGTIAFGCIYTSPCVANASSGGGVTVTVTGGGQSFLNLGNNSTGYFNTNGTPDFSIYGTLAGNPFYSSGWFFINELSSINAQAITWINPGQAGGKCSVVKTLSNIDTGLQGVPYLPCNRQTQEVQQSLVSLTAGATSFTVASAAGIQLGHVVTDVAVPTGTWTAGQPNIVVSAAAGICIGAHVQGAGINAGATVTNVVGTTISVGGCGVSGPKCSGGYPLYQAQTSVPVYFTGCLMSNASVVTSINGTTIGISDQVKSSGTAQNIWFQGTAVRNSIYD